MIQLVFEDYGGWVLCFQDSWWLWECFEDFGLWDEMMDQVSVGSIVEITKNNSNIIGIPSTNHSQVAVLQTGPR